MSFSLVILGENVTCTHDEIQITRIALLTGISDLNPIEHVWDDENEDMY